MKAVIIFLLLIIVGLLGYNQYAKYKRFNVPGASYTTSESVDLEYYDQSFVINYHKAVQDIDSYVISQWSVNGIDVRNPEEEDADDQLAVQEYHDKLAVIKYYEAKLEQSTKYKSQGLSNQEILMLDRDGISLSQKRIQEQQQELMNEYNSHYGSRDMRIGDRGPMVYYIQKILVSKGYDIPIDGNFQRVTREAVAAFEEKANLFVDGAVDRMTFRALMGN